MKKPEKFAEFEIHDYAIEILHEEVKKIKRKKEREAEDMARLEKMIRSYATLMDSMRSNAKDKVGQYLLESGKISGEYPTDSTDQGQKQD